MTEDDRSSTFRAFTIVGRNYLAHARVLGESLRRTNPMARFDVFLLDDDGSINEADEPFGILTPADVFDAEAFDELVAIYNVMELATAVKPVVLRHLLDNSDGPAMYLDPDLWFFGSLDHVAELAVQHDIVLTPHAVAPIHRDGRRPAETEILKSGVYNLGFVAVGQGARPFLDWWWDRLKRDCVVAPEDGLFVDQRWIDFAPGLFDHTILKDPGYNVAYWNLGERDLAWTDGGYTVDGHTLVFAHFSGFDATKPYILSKHTQPNPRVLLSEKPAVARICRDYAKAMLDAGFEEANSIPFDLDRLPNGVLLDATMRHVYRKALVDYENSPEDAERIPPPSPFSDPDVFMAWLSEPAGGQTSGIISRYLEGLWTERTDLQRAFGSLTGEDAVGFVRWVMDYGRHEQAIPPQVLPRLGEDLTNQFDRSESRASGAEPASGVNVAGYVRAELGVGEAARKMGETVVAAGEDLALLAYSGTPSRQDHPVGDVLEAGIDAPPYDVNVVTINADSTVQFARDVGASFYDHRYTVGMWAWEVEEFPDAWLTAFDHVDEVWMNSAYARDAVKKAANKPVYSFPLTVSVPPSEAAPKADFDLPDRFMFLFSFDFFSIFERKNPLALVAAFTEAFAPGDGPILVIKSINGDKRMADLERLRVAAADHPDIYVMDGYLPVDLKNRLVATCDAYVSLHRSEGFGLTMAEAMALGKPTIGTGYSGNLEFMNASNSYLVDYTRAEVPAGCDPYPEGAAWAEPDIVHASELMRRVYEDQDDAKRVGERAKETIEESHSPEALAVALRENLQRIRQTKAEWSKRSALRDSEIASIGLPTLLALTKEAIERPLANRWSDDGSGGARSRLRDAALGVVRPAMARERAIDENLLEAIIQLWSRVDHLDTASVRAAASLEVEIDRAERRDAAVREMLDRLASEGSAAAAGALSFRTDATIHLARMSEQVGDVEDLAGTTDAALHSRPYMADPDIFLVGDGSMGFDEARPGDPYRDFEDVFRGDERFILERQRVYLSMLGDGPVLDAGSGRGEFLDLLTEQGISGVGVDLDRGMVDRCISKGHDVVLGDAIEYLKSAEDQHYGSVFSAQFIEHIPLSRLVEFMELSARKLLPDGVFIAETVNPHSLPAFRTFWTDLTHRAPIYPEVALSFLRSAGFASGRIVFPNGGPDLETNLRSAGEYAVVGRVPGLS